MFPLKCRSDTYLLCSPYFNNSTQITSCRVFRCLWPTPFFHTQYARWILHISIVHVVNILTYRWFLFEERIRHNWSVDPYWCDTEVVSAGVSKSILYYNMYSLFFLYWIMLYKSERDSILKVNKTEYFLTKINVRRKKHVR